MTHIAATSHAAATTETRRAQSSRAGGASFAQAHIAAVTKDKDKTSSADAKSTSTPKSERTDAVDGHSYREIVSGPRNGMFINNSGNARDGRAFVIVKREGREFHIYGTGKDRNVYEVGRERAASGTSQGSGTTGTTDTGATTTGTTGQTGSSPSASTPATT